MPQAISRRYLVCHSLLMLGLGTSLFFLASIMTNPEHEESGYIVAVALTCLTLIAALTYQARSAKHEGNNQMIRIQIVTGSLTIGSWAVFWLIRSAPVELRLLCILAGLHGLYWGLWYLRLAFVVSTNRNKAIPLSVLAAITTVLGIVIATEPDLTKLSVVTAVSCFTMFLGVQILLTSAFLCRNCETTARLSVRPKPEQRLNYHLSRSGD